MALVVQHEHELRRDVGFDDRRATEAGEAGLTSRKITRGVTGRARNARS
jgi:hypothetical protein